MKTTLNFLVVLLLAVVMLSFRCDRGAYDSCDTGYKTDTVLLNTTVVNPNLQYRIYDTIWLNSIVNDSYVPLSGTPATVTYATERLFSSIQPFRINTSTSLPTLQFANIEFNPVVKEGSLQYSAYNGYNYEYKRLAPNNSLIAGLVPGRTGLYIIQINSNFGYGGNFQFSTSQNSCASYIGNVTLPVNQQNQNYWNTLGVTTVSMPQNYGAYTISRSMRNYLIVEVIP